MNQPWQPIRVKVRIRSELGSKQRKIQESRWKVTSQYVQESESVKLKKDLGVKVNYYD